ncbi:Flp family type IVb pilin [Arthrobacter sp. TWP1-1]|uniref:Flp family type IVb pilin n=1 Tax=Arthrobacter sp. TWP1-1 TaxID=2804568 RepID=UPI003CF50205
MLKLYVTMQSMFIATADRFRDGERGATATEYALLVAFIALAIAGTVTAFGGQLSDFFDTLGTEVGIVAA